MAGIIYQLHGSLPDQTLERKNKRYLGGRVCISVRSKFLTEANGIIYSTTSPEDERRRDSILFSTRTALLLVYWQSFSGGRRFFMHTVPIEIKRDD